MTFPDSTPRLLVVTPTLGETPLIEQTVRGVAALRLPLLHVLAAPASRIGELKSRFPGTLVVADAGRAGGVYGAINAGLAAVPSGWDWFTYINDDDLLLPGFETLYARHMLLPGRPAVGYGDVALMREDGSVLSRITTERTPSWIPALLQQGISPLMQQGTIFRRDVVERLGAFDLRYRLCADLDFWLRALTSGFGFRHHAVTVAGFRLRSGQLSSDTRLTEREQEAIVASLLPARVAPVVRILAKCRYRLLNLPRYVERARMGGLRTSYALLASGAVPTK